MQTILTQTSKMPCPSISISAELCKTGSKLAKIEGTVCHKCYALRGNYLYPSVKQKHQRVLEFMNSPDFVQRMTGLIMANGNNYFRWFDSGDIQSEEMAHRILDVCEATDWVNHWIPTKEYKMWRNVLASRPLPKNAVVRYSTHKDDMRPTRAGDYTSTTFTAADSPANVGTVCKADAIKEATGTYSCGSCRACWDKSVSNIAYPKRYEGKASKAAHAHAVKVNSVN